MDVGAALTAAEYLKALRIRTKVRAAFGRVFQEVDALVTPQLPITAPRIGEDHVKIGRRMEAVPDALTRFTRINNLVGIPSLSIPCGFSSEGLPIALQISAKPFDESTVLRIGDAYQRRSGDGPAGVPARTPQLKEGGRDEDTDTRADGR